MNNYPDDFAFVQIHHGDAYATTWGNQRATYYGLSGYPSSWMDGIVSRVGAWPYTTYRNDMLARLTVPTYVNVQVGGQHVSGNTYNVRAWVCVDDDASGPITMYLHMVQVLDHWPFTPTYHRNGFKLAAPTDTLTLGPGECQMIDHDFTFDSTSMANTDDIEMVVWAQRYSGGKEVYNSTKMHWPFSPLQALGDFDGDGDVDEADAAELYACLGGPGVVADQTCRTVFDFDEDTNVDLGDVAEFMLLYTGRCPGVTTQPQSVTLCEGETASFSIVADGSGALFYEWRHNGLIIPGADQPALEIQAVTFDDEGAYTCAVRNTCGETISAGANLVIRYAAITNQTGNRTGCMGQPLDLSVTAGGVPPFYYQWYKGPNALPGETSNILHFDALEETDEANYRCEVYGDCNSVMSNIMHVTVSYAPSFSDEPDDTCVEAGQTAQLCATPEGQDTMFYQWVKNGLAISSGNADPGMVVCLDITDAQEDDEGEYWIEILDYSSPTCVISSAHATLTVGGCP